MRFFILLISFLSTIHLHSQIVFEKTSHDFGDLTAISERFIDIVVTNKGIKKEFLLSVKKPTGVVYLVNGQFMDKDGSLTIRLQVNPKGKGKFNYEVQIFTSDKDAPTIIKLNGNVVELEANQNSLQACPDFSVKPSTARQHATDFLLTVVTIDKTTRQVLSESSVTILQNGRPIGNFPTNKNGEIKKSVPLGFTYFYASHTGYFPHELGSYINFNRNLIVLELEQKPIINDPVIAPQTEPEIVAELPIDKEDKTTSEIEITLDKELSTEQTTSREDLEPVIQLSLNELDPENFEDKNFKPINVTFVLDVSASMRAGEKMELMKYALYQLTDMLRPQDRIALVTYATDTRVILPPTSGDQKEQIKKLVGELRAGGLTAGGAGIKLGYQQTLKAYIPDGTNQIIMITDGAFNRNSDDYKKYIKKYQKKGINMSVVGILNSERDKSEMEEAAKLGGGRYVPIFKLADARNNLKQEIRYLSIRR